MSQFPYPHFCDQLNTRNAATIRIIVCNVVKTEANQKTR